MVLFQFCKLDECKTEQQKNKFKIQMKKVLIYYNDE